MINHYFKGYQGDCDSVCYSNRDCLSACQTPLDPMITSDMSSVHCGLHSFRASAVSAVRRPTNRILNGNDAEDREFPWIVALHTVLSEL